MPVRVLVHIDAPIAKVFDAVSDHESFIRSDDGTTTKIVRPGKSERNGLGCLREVRAARRARYLEEVTAWDRPASFEYLIQETSMPLRHSGSRLAFTPRGTGTDVEWTSRFEITVPVVGRLLRVLAERVFAKAFTELLAAAKVTLEGDPRQTGP